MESLSDSPWVTQLAEVKLRFNSHQSIWQWGRVREEAERLTHMGERVRSAQ